jgi:hypothetical protein
MLSGPNYITSINHGIKGIAGYYTDDDSWQHVIAAAEDGYVYEVHWDPNELAPGYQPSAEKLEGHFGDSPVVTIAGFFTPDDKYHHAVACTKDGKVHEIYYKLDELPHTNTTVLPYPPISSFDPSKGMASFYSPGDDLRHVVIVDGMGNPVDITWKGHHPTNGIGITIPPTDSQVASISGFLSNDANPNTRHIIVARNDTGQIYDIAYADEQHVPRDIRGQDHVYVKTTFHEQVRNVTAFFSSDTNYRHIVVFTQANLLKDHAYDANGGNLRSTQLTSSALANVADITSFYNAHDQLRHVLYATYDGSLYEITYTSQG